jgi:hypothetical protein
MIEHMFEQDERAELDRMVELQTTIARAEAELAESMSAFVRSRRGSEVLVAEFAGDELAAALRWGRGRVQARLGLVTTLRTDLPATWAAWRAGAIDGFAATKIAEARYRILDASLLPAFDRDAATAAAAKSWGQLQSWLNQRVAAAEPDQLEERYRRAFKDRRVATSQDLDGMGRLWATTSAVDLSAIDYRLTRLAQDCGGDDPRTLEQRRADLFVDLLLGQSSSGDQEPKVVSAAPAAAAVAVTVPVQSLVGTDDSPGAIVGGGPVPASVVREIAGRPGTLFYRLLTDGRGDLLDVEQLGRFPSRLLGFAVDARDQTCRFPGCSRPAVVCDCDHTIPHPEGPTAYRNLGCLCRRHHRCKQSPGYRVAQVEPGVFEWAMPTGHTYTVHGDPLPVGRWPDHPEEPDELESMYGFEDLPPPGQGLADFTPEDLDALLGG